MFKLDDNLLRELGLAALPAEEKNKMLAHIYETLELRVGMRLAEQMSDQQLDEFEGFIDRNDEAGALKWLETNFPDYKQVVADELDKLKAEVKQQAPQILEATNAQMQGSGQPPQQPTNQPPQDTAQQPDSFNPPVDQTQQPNDQNPASSA